MSVACCALLALATLLVPSAADTRALEWSQLRSRHQALVEDGNPRHRVVLFHDVVLWQSQLYYVTDTPAGVSLPRIVVDWLNDRDLTEDLLTVKPSGLPFDDNNAAVETLVVQEALLGRFINYQNYYHSTAETLPTWHNLICKYRQLCTYNASSDLRIFTVGKRRLDEDYTMDSPAVTEMLLCFSKHPVLELHNNALQNKALVLRNALVGIGLELRAHHEWANWYGEWFESTWVPPSLDMAASWRRRLASCFALDFVDNRVQRNKLKITFVNRLYRTGRHIDNIDTLVHQTAAAFPSAEVTLEYLEDMPLRRQIGMYMSISIVCWPHGASMANLNFLPQGAAAVEVLPWQEQRTHPHMWAQKMVADLGLNISLSHVYQQDRHFVTFMKERLTEDADYLGMSPQEKVALLEQGECPERLKFKCIAVWDHHYVSFVITWDQLGPALHEAWAAVMGDQQQ